MTAPRCVNVERIAVSMGGGHLCTGVCGRPHLHGRPWKWWQCKLCQRIEATQLLRNRQQHLLDLYYPGIA